MAGECLIVAKDEATQRDWVDVANRGGMVRAHRVGVDAVELSRTRTWLREVGSVVQVCHQTGKGLY